METGYHLAKVGVGEHVFASGSAVLVLRMAL